MDSSSLALLSAKQPKPCLVCFDFTQMTIHRIVSQIMEKKKIKKTELKNNFSPLPLLLPLSPFSGIVLSQLLSFLFLDGNNKCLQLGKHIILLQVHPYSK